MEHMESLAWLNDLLPHVRLGEARHHGNLSLVPLFGPATGPQLVTLDEALRDCTVEITEVSEAGSVPVLQVHNRGKLALLLFDGEELVGAKQNRILNSTILVAAETSLRIPVSCVEQGRWSWRSQRFGTEGRVMKQGMRRSKAARMTATLEVAPARYDADQTSVWREVAEYAERRGTRSATSAMADVFEADRPAIESFVEALPRTPGQTGVAAFIGGELVGIDLLGSASAFASLHPKLVRALAAEAVDTPRSGSEARLHAVGDTLERLRSARRFEARPPGLGTDVRFEAPELHAAGLVAAEGLVHLAVFAAA